MNRKSRVADLHSRCRPDCKFYGKVTSRKKNHNVFGKCCIPNNNFSPNDLNRRIRKSSIDMFNTYPHQVHSIDDDDDYHHHPLPALSIAVQGYKQ
ncbi:MAG TPA: hypothetical protein VH796_18370 [Nitrososphaeraceae archaeon]